MRILKHELKALAAEVGRLSRLLTRGREDLPPAYLKDRKLRDAYRAYFLPPNLGKIEAVLAELAHHPGGIPERKRLRILDLGCGPGTSLLGILEFFGARMEKPVLDCVAVDQVAENLAAAEELFAAYRDRNVLTASLKTLCGNVEHAAGLAAEPFDLIILSNVLNELFAREPERTGKRLTLLGGLTKGLLAEHGACIIIEPALRETSRELLQVRDGLPGLGITIFAPCLYRGACPALANPKDWCHEDLPWEPPALIRELDRLTGLRKDSLKFSRLILRKDGLSQSDIYRGNAFRVVSEPLSSKGKREFYLCGSAGRKLATRLDKDASGPNADFAGLRRGDVAGFEGLIDEEKRYKVSRETRVSVLHRVR